MTKIAKPFFDLEIPQPFQKRVAELMLEYPGLGDGYFELIDSESDEE